MYALVQKAMSYVTVRAKTDTEVTDISLVDVMVLDGAGWTPWCRRLCLM